MTRAMLVRGEIMEAVGGFLTGIELAGGKVSRKVFNEQVEIVRSCGYTYWGIIANVALLSLGKPAPLPQDRAFNELTQEQVQSLVNEAKQKHGIIIHRIQALREARQS